ncbi:MAG TPA: Cof-type HAD-IIB family hydrolase, partial [Bdellovibrionota bacterium]|nr:Cof-type HAD-IIB family hydrolase [Bdellovibrionota bacterium]
KEVREEASGTAGLGDSSGRQSRPELCYQLLLFDLDGTLLTQDRRIAEENREALGRLMRAGVRVGLATGRTLRSAKPYADAIGANGPLILFNGARVWDRARGGFLFGRDLPRQEAFLALELKRRLPELADAHVNLYVDDEILIEKRTERSMASEAKDGVPHTVVGDLSDWLKRRGGDPIKLMLIAGPEQLEIFQAEFDKRSSGVCDLIRSEREYLELTRKGVNKGSALGEMLALYGIPRSKVVAFGDNLNDVELLRESGLGVAMGNAHAGLKAVAGRVIGPHTTDSIRAFLEETFPRELGVQ